MIALTQHEHFFSCPYCGENISVLIDSSVPDQHYIEDCEVCCRPITIHYQLDEEAQLCHFTAD